jgi:hypothetical protein
MEARWKPQLANLALQPPEGEAESPVFSGDTVTRSTPTYTCPALVMKGSPVRVRASALSVLQGIRTTSTAVRILRNVH